MANYWPTIHAERKALASDLAGLTDEQWSTPTTCDRWTVRDVVAHMTATAKVTPASFFPKLIGSGFSFNRMQTKDIAIERGTSPADCLARFESIVDLEKAPPGPPQTPLGEVIIHSEDVRSALEIQHSYPTDMVVTLADFYKGSNLLIGTKRRIAGLSLQAVDTDWSYGSGPEVFGPMTNLLMAMTGRKAALDHLSGDGVGILRSRP